MTPCDLTHVVLLGFLAARFCRAIDAEVRLPQLLPGRSLPLSVLILAPRQWEDNVYSHTSPLEQTSDLRLLAFRQF